MREGNFNNIKICSYQRFPLNSDLVTPNDKKYMFVAHYIFLYKDASEILIYRKKFQCKGWD